MFRVCARRSARSVIASPRISALPACFNNQQPAINTRNSPPSLFQNNQVQSRRGVVSEAMEAIKTSVQNTIGENFGGVAQDASTHQFKLDQVPSQEGKVAVVTGGSEGIGFGCTHTLLSKNISKLYILSPNKDVVDGAKEALSKELGPDAAAKTHWIQCDLSDWSRVAAVAKEIRSSTDRLDILINNAARGIMTFKLAENGVDRHMAVNHFGHTILTSHLLPLIAKTSEKHNTTVRIVNMASNAHQNAPSDVKFADLDELNQDIGPNGLYGRSKLAIILYTRYLAKQLKAKYPKILVNCTHPGIVSTKQSKVDIHEAYPLAGYAMSVLMEPFKKDQFEGCVSAMFAATTTTETGQYICPPAVPEDGSAMSQDEALGEQLMKLTREVVTEKTKSESVDKGCPMDLVVLH